MFVLKSYGQDAFHLPNGICSLGTEFHNLLCLLILNPLVEIKNKSGDLGNRGWFVITAEAKKKFCEN